MFSTVANQLSDNENAALNEYLSDPNSAHNLVPSQPETLAAYEASGADATQIAAFAAAQGDA